MCKPCGFIVRVVHFSMAPFFLLIFPCGLMCLVLAVLAGAFYCEGIWWQSAAIDSCVSSESWVVDVLRSLPLFFNSFLCPPGQGLVLLGVYNGYWHHLAHLQWPCLPAMSLPTPGWSCLAVEIYKDLRLKRLDAVVCSLGGRCGFSLHMAYL